MEQYNNTPTQEEHRQSNAPLKIFEIVVFIAAVVGALYYYIYYIKIAPQDPQEQIQKQREEAVKTRDVSLCPNVQNPFNNTIGVDSGCVSAIKNLTTLDAVNTIIVRAIKEKNEKLCDSTGKDFKEVCIQAVRDARNGVTKTISNPLLGR